MEPLYCVQRKQNNFSYFNIPSIVRVSSCNILALVTPNNLQDSQCMAYASHLFVCDLISPWKLFKVTSNKCCITVLEWDVSSKYLLTGDSEGVIQIWVQKDYYLSEWIQLYVVMLPGENILKVSFFHNGRKILYSSDKRDVIHYTEKFQSMKYSQSVRQFGGVAAEGVLVLTSSGLLASFLLPSEQSLVSQNISNGNSNNCSTNATTTNSNTPYFNAANNSSSGPFNLQTYPGIPYRLTPITQSLGVIRIYLSTATIAYGKNTPNAEESFRIAVANAETRTKQSNFVKCYRVLIKIIDGKLTMTSQSLPSFFLCEGAGRDIPGLKITHLSWISNEEPESLIVVAKHNTGTLIELWSLVEKVTPIHKLLQINKSEVYKTITWANQTNFRHGSVVVDICISKIDFDNSCIFLIMADNSIQIFGKDLKRVSTLTSSINLFDNSEQIFKQPRTNAKLVSHDVTYFNHLLLGLDNYGQIYTFKLPQTYYEQCDKGNALSAISNIASLLEYSMNTGYDPSDIFVSIRPNLLEQVIDKLTESFTRQPAAVQQYYYVKFLTMKINLYRLSASGQSRANDLTCLLMLHSILIAFKSLLRPSDLANYDKGPAENLAMVLSESVPDVDKVLLNLDAKDFTVEPSTLQSLQQLIQWVADLALNILVKLPQTCAPVGQMKNIGYEISKDIVALNSIRELLVMIRIWGLLNTQCLPVFSRSVENLDILATLFRLLTRLALNPTEPDEGLLDECCLLPSQVLIPYQQFMSSVASITSPVLHLNTLPLQLTYDVEPESLKFWRECPIIECSLANDSMIDSIRNLYLGKKPYAVRRCLRCGSLSSIASVAKTAAVRAWEQRWSNSCRCGGFWIYQKYK